MAPPARRPTGAAHSAATPLNQRRGAAAPTPFKVKPLWLLSTVAWVALTAMATLPFLVHRAHDSGGGSGGGNAEKRSGRTMGVPPPIKKGAAASSGKLADAAAAADENPAGASSAETPYRFVVSSDCTTYQMWETITQLYSYFQTLKSGDGVGKGDGCPSVGRYTWIVSGCLDESSHPHVGKGKGGAQSDVLTEDAFRRTVESYLKLTMPIEDGCMIKPQLHFTPDYSDMRVYGGPYADGTLKRSFRGRNGNLQYGSYGNNYKFNNKPNGLLHWSRSKSSSSEDEVIVLIDPDFLFLKPFALPPGAEGAKPGKPAAANYGLGAQWLDFNVTAIVGPNSTCLEVSDKEVNQYYSAGPPYMIHSSDVRRLAERWVELVPPTYDQYPLLYAEMFAYSMAAVDLGLKHELIRGLFTGCMTGWPRDHGNEPIRAAVRDSAMRYRASLLEESEGRRGGKGGGGNDGGGAKSCFVPPLDPPPFLHYCQRYAFRETVDLDVGEGDADGAHNAQVSSSPRYRFFAKRRVDHDILNCDKPALEPFVSEKTEKIAGGKEDWTTLAACAVVRAVNYARERSCGTLSQ